ncbi:MAG TPA: DUF1186 domain-containing protein [bacterium]
MTRGGKNVGNELQFAELLSALRRSDHWLENVKLKKIVSYGDRLLPHLEDILTQSLDSNLHPSQPGDCQPQGYAVLHALFLLTHLQAEKSLPVILKFLSQKPDFLDCYLHDSLLDEIWEVLFGLGENHLAELEKFVLNTRNNTLSRLAVCTALIQIALHHPTRKRRVTQAFKGLLSIKNDDPDFIGLVISELLDLKSPTLRPFMLAVLSKNEVWSGIISVEDVSRSYKDKHVRKLIPIDLFERYRLYTRFAHVTPVKTLHKTQRRVEKSW